MTATKINKLGVRRELTCWCRENLILFTRLEVEKQVMMGFLMSIAIVACIRLLEHTGGLPSVYEHLIYIPLVLVGLLIGPRVAALAGFVCGLYLSPIWFEGVIADSESAVAWLLRLAMLTLLPAAMGLLSKAVKETAEAAEKASRTYEGTDLPNMKAMEERLNTLVGKTERGSSDLMDVFNLKLKNFEQIQNRIGRDKANKLMQEFAAKLKHTLADSVSLGQTSNNELVGLNNHATESSQAIEEKLKGFFEKPLIVDGVPYQIDATTGMLRVKADQVKASPGMIFEQAQQHRFEAEKQNKDFAFVEQHDDLIPEQVNNFSQELLDALEHHDIQIFYQPRLNTHSGYFSVLEAVVRWIHPKRGEMQFEEFLPLLEEPNLVQQFTCWTVKESFKDIRQLQHKGHPARISVHITIDDVIHSSVLCAVARELQFSRSLAKNLYLEVSEKSLMKIASKPKQYLERLRRMGVNIIVTGFGEGRSTIQALFAMPVDAVKLCDTLVDKAVSNSDGRHELTSVVKLARSKGLITIASGVNDRQKLIMLKQIGCGELQGNILSRPVERKEIPWARIR